MKITVLMAVLAAGAASAATARQEPAPERKVTVCSQVPPGIAFVQARSMSVRIFARIGVVLEWHDNKNCPATGLRMTLSTRTPDDLKPGALAYAMPYEGTHIVVFLDRIQVTVNDHRASAVLAHVFAHEIGHILQGSVRHSDSGIMQAKWSPRDFDVMLWKPLTFSPKDVELIYDGLAQRARVTATVLP